MYGVVAVTTSGGASHNVCGANPYVTPQVAMPAFRPVRTSTDESPTIIASRAATPASLSRVFTPSGSGFFVSKLLPPYTCTKNLPSPSSSTIARDGRTGLGRRFGTDTVAAIQ